MSENKITKDHLRNLVAKIEQITGVLTVYEESELSMSKPHLKLSYTGYYWKKQGSVICLKFNITHYSSGIGEIFLVDTINSCINFSAETITNPEQVESNDTIIHYVEENNINNYFVIYDNKNEIPMQKIEGKEIFARPYKLEYIIKL